MFGFGAVRSEAKGSWYLGVQGLWQGQGWWCLHHEHRQCCHRQKHNQEVEGADRGLISSSYAFVIHLASLF